MLVVTCWLTCWPLLTYAADSWVACWLAANNFLTNNLMTCLCDQSTTVLEHKQATQAAEPTALQQWGSCHQKYLHHHNSSCCMPSMIGHPCHHDAQQGKINTTLLAHSSFEWDIMQSACTMKLWWCFASCWNLKLMTMLSTQSNDNTVSHT